MSALPVFAFLGDSLTLSGTGTEDHSWPHKMDNDLDLVEQLEVANFGKSGDQSDGFLARYLAEIAGKGYGGLGIKGCINDVTNSVSAATSWANIKQILDHWIANEPATKPLLLIATSPAGGSAGFTPTMLVQQLELRADFAAYAAAHPTRVIYFDEYAAFPVGLGDPANPGFILPAADFGDKKHLNSYGGDLEGGRFKPTLLLFYPSPTPPAPEVTVNTFGVTSANFYTRYLPQMNPPSPESNPSNATVTDIINECAADLDGKLLQESISSGAIVDPVSAPYLWCRQTLRLMVMVEVLPVLSQQDGTLLKRLTTELTERLEDFAENGYLALGTGAAAPSEEPDGPTDFIDHLNLDTSANDSNASSVTMPFHKDDLL